MYQFSRAIYRELAGEIVESEQKHAYLNHQRVLQACEDAMERLATDRHYFAHPARTLFQNIRVYFPLSAQRRVWSVVERYMRLADEFLRDQAQTGFDIHGKPLLCRASTRKGTQCQRTPLASNGYCPSHQHLAETDELSEFDELQAA